MTSLLKNSVRRCRPLLGTFVEITVEHEDGVCANAAIDRAFAAIEGVHKRMSFHDPGSELSMLNRQAFYEDVPVSLDTFEVLRAAKRLYELSGGLFDITVGSELMARGLLPRLNTGRFSWGRSSDIILGPSGTVRFLQPICLDLGGIAKGFAVDQAVGVLRSSGMDSGLVNAGGDLRCFGTEPRTVHVRHPRAAGKFFALPPLINTALATSARGPGQGGAHIHGKTRKPLKCSFSVSVQASKCMIADALTKIVLGWGRKAAGVLSELNAQAWVVYPDDSCECIGKTGYETP